MDAGADADAPAMQPPSIGAVVAFVAVSFVTLLWLTGFFQKPKFPRVPGGWPILGHMFDLMRVSALNDTFEEWLEKHGTCEFSVMGQKFLLISKWEELKPVLAKRPRKIRRFPIVTEVVDFITPGLFTAEGDQWSYERKMVAPSLSHKNLETYVPTIRLVTDRLMQLWTDEGSGGKALPVLEYTYRWAEDIIALIAYAQDFDTLRRRSPEADALKVAFQCMSERLTSPFPYYKIPIIGPYLDGYEKSRALLHKLVHKAITEAREKGTKGTALEKFLEANKEQGISDERLVGNLLTFFVAGSETTATASAYLMHYLARDKELQEAAYQEAMAATVTDESTFQGVIAQFTLLRSTLQETLRLKGPVGFFWLENHEEPIEVAGKTIQPKEYCLTWPFRWFNIKNAGDLAGPDPEKFNGRRWIAEDGSLIPLPEQMTPFGQGMRICPGRDLAILDSLILVSTVLKKFRLDTPDDNDIKATFRMALQPSRPILVTFTPRE